MTLENLIDEALRIKGLNEHLLDASHNLLFRLIRKCKENGIPIDNETLALIADVRIILGEIHNPVLTSFSPTKSQQRNKTTDDETEPKFIIQADPNIIRHIIKKIIAKKLALLTVV